MHFVVPKHLCKKKMALFQTPVGAACGGTLTSPEAFTLEATSSFQVSREKYFNDHIYNIILASFLDFNFLKACSSLTMSCGVQVGPWTRWTWNFLRRRKVGKTLQFVIPRNFRETHPNTPSGVPKLWTFRSNQTLKRDVLGTSGLSFANIQEAGKFMGVQQGTFGSGVFSQLGGCISLVGFWSIKSFLVFAWIWHFCVVSTWCELFGMRIAMVNNTSHQYIEVDGWCCSIEFNQLTTWNTSWASCLLSNPGLFEYKPNVSGVKRHRRHFLWDPIL